MDWKQQRDKYLTERVLDQINWYGQKSARNKNWYYICRSTIIISGAMIPLLVGYAEDGRNWPKYLAGALGALIVIAEGIMSLKKYRENWSIYRATGENLRREQLMFENNVGEDYASADEEAFKHFVLRAEKIMASENEEWTSKLEADQQK